MFSSENWFGASAGFYNGVATQSLRFDDGSSAYLGITPSSAGNRKTFTFSGWVKRGNIGTNQDIFNAGVNNGSLPRSSFRFKTDDTISIGFNPSASTWYYSITSRVFRDVSSWYHLILSVDTTQSTDRVKLYVNGELQTFASQSVPSQNTDLTVNNTVGHSIGVYGGGNRTSSFYDGYMAEVNFVDGLALDPTYFGEFKNGVWIPKKYTGSYGTNGFRLQFNQTGTGTASASTIGADTSGQTNHFTSSGIVASDCNMPDSPELNMATLNAIEEQSRNTTFSEGNLQAVIPTSQAIGKGISTIAVSSGKWYWEIYYKSSTGSYLQVGLQTTDGSKLYHIRGYDGERWDNGSPSSGTSARFSSTSVIGVALDLDNGKWYIANNNTYQDAGNGTGDPTGGSGQVHSSLSGEFQFYTGNATGSGTQTYVANFGQDSSFAGNKTAQGNTDGNDIGDFYYAPPSGFLALCTANLPEPTISPNANTQADDYFTPYIWTGNDSNPRAFTDVGFQADWIWIKKRSGSGTSHHITADSSRGDNKTMLINADNSEATNDLNGYISDTTTAGGFTVNAGSSSDEMVNDGSDTYVAWLWKAGGTTPTKTYKVVVVSDSGNKYRFRNSADSTTFAQSAVTLDLQEGGTYTFDYSDSTATSHPFRFSTTSDGTHGGGSEYTTGVVKDDTAKTITITVASSAPTLYYYCSAHSGMGGQVNTNTTFGQTNFDGSILSVSNANTTAGFSIVTYTGTGSNATVGHGLSTPDVVIVKRRSSAGFWTYWGTQFSASTHYIYLNTTAGTDTGGATITNSTFPSSTVFSIGTSTFVNGNTDTYVAYCFHSVEGFSRFGKFTGNGNADGTFVALNFRPSFVMVKTTGIASDWVIEDTTRSPFNESNATLFANLSNAEYTDGAYGVDLLSNGFKIYNTYNQWNASGQGYIYMAFAESPFKYANAR